MKTNYFNTLFSSRLKRKYFQNIVLSLAFLPACINAQQSYTFTTASATGAVGPTQTQINTAYLSTNLNGSVTVTNGIQSFTVPNSGNYRIETYGASGGTSSTYLGGLGAKMAGDFSLTAGSVLKILVGQAGIAGLASFNGDVEQSGGTGGGGSYVVTSANVPLIVSGGGGGSSQSGSGGGLNATGASAPTTSNGIDGGGASGSGGTGGAGGLSYNWTGWHGGTGGGGFTGNGVNNSAGSSTYGTVNGPGYSFLNGGAGGTAGSYGRSGGFGGGGASGFTGAGGGGYSGGGAGSTSGSPSVGGGGGGSYNTGTNQTNTAAFNTGNGKVVITELCSISLVASGTNTNGAICSGATVTLTTNAVSNYSWNTGATTSSIVVSPTVTTLYSLTGASALSCTTSAAINIIVDPTVPTLTIANTANSGGICPSKTVALTASGATSYSWTGGTTTVTNGVVFAPTTTSGYTVTGYNACGNSTAVTSVSIHPTPTITPVASTSSLCSGLTLTLTGVGNSTAYVWSGGTIPITNGVGFSPIASVNYSVIGTSALTCTALATVSVLVVQTPSFAPTANSGVICIGQTSTLTATGATNYTWTGGAAVVNTSTLAVTPTATGISTYTITRSNSNCVDTKTISVLTNSLPVVFAIVNPTLVCALNPATLAVGGAQSYTWTSPTLSFTGSSPVVSPPASTTYTVLGFNGTCSNTTTVFLAANPNPTITTVPSTTNICRGQSITMTANGGINYTWTATTGTFYTAAITDTPNIATAYNVTGDNSFGCTSGAGVVVIVNNNPTITIVPSKTLVCSNGPSTLTAAGANTYTWDANANGAFTNTTIVHPVSLTSAPVIYTVQGTYTLTGCQSSKTIAVSVFVPTLTISGNTNTCYGGLITLNAGGGVNNSYSWNTGSGTPYGFNTISTTLTAPATWTLSANSLSAGVTCPATKTVALGIFYNPTVTAVAQRTIICRNESVMLTGGGAVTYTWSNNMAGTTITVSPTGTSANFTATGTDANGCTSTGTVQVKISGCTGINALSNAADLNIYPNPNEGNFTIETNADLRLTLLNELGQLVRIIELSGANSYNVSVTDLAKGIYFISGQKDNIQINQKIVVTK